MSITTSKPKLLTAICNCCCTQNHQPLPFLLLPSPRENKLTTPLQKGKKNTATTNTTTIPKNKKTKKGDLFPSSECRNTTSREKKESTKRYLGFLSLSLSLFVFLGVLFKILELEERQNPIEST
jgi:hypothetical protein